MTAIIFDTILLEMNIDPIIPGRKNQIEPIDHNRHTYKERNAIERFFGASVLLHDMTKLKLC